MRKHRMGTALSVLLMFGSSVFCQDACPPPQTLFQWPGATVVAAESDVDPERDTDRPDFTESTSTVGRRTIQLEAGYTFSSDDDASGHNRGHSWGEPLLRVGVLADWMEFRLGYFPVTSTTQSGGSE